MARSDFASAQRFIKAKHFLYDDDELREKYFTTNTIDSEQIEGEYYPPRSDWIEGVIPSADYIQAVRDKSHDPNVGGTIIPLCDSKCPRWDAARHIDGLKRNVITVPQTEDTLKEWIMAGDKKYQKYLVFFDKRADWQNFIGWKKGKRRKRK